MRFKFKFNILKKYITHFIKSHFGRNQIWQISVLMVVLAILSTILFLSGVNNANNRSKVLAGIVNNDIPVTIDNQTAPLGRQFASQLSQTKDTNYSWTITSQQDANDKLLNGEYVAVVTIPANFSKSITSIKDIDSATKAYIQIQTSDKTTTNTDDITTSLVNTAEKTFANTYVLDSFLSQIFVGFQTLKSGLNQATDGSKRLLDGTEQLNTGVKQLSDNSDALKNGSLELANGLDQINNQIKQTNQIDVKQLVLIMQYAKTISTFLASIDLYNLDNKIATPICQLANLHPELPVLQQICDNIKGLTKDITCIENGGPKVNPQCTNWLYADFIGVKKIEELIDKDSALADKLIYQLPLLERAINDLAKGSSQLNDGINQYTNGVDEIAKNTSSLVNGTKQLSDGLAKAANQIPNYNNNQQTKIKSLLEEPIKLQDVNLNLFKELAYLIIIILWLVCYANSNILRLVPKRVRQSLNTSTTLALAALIPPVVISIFESIIVSTLAQIFIKLPTNIWPKLILVCIFIGITFTIVMQTIGVLLKNKAASLTLALLIAVVYIIERGFIYTPSLLHIFDFLMPTGYATDVLSNIILQNGHLLNSLIILIIYAIICFLITIYIISRRRQFTISEIYTV
ncbi:MAG: ABC transporter permease [Bifidobacteriaceae bacterium]|jgi:putative membrane protein|nr:ABC transporter permease [Bifidobacteriaceae bacterium]